mgnify:FL=1
MKNKDRVISLRVEEELAGYIEEQAKEWDMSISEALRFMLEAFYSPTRSRQKAYELIEEMTQRVSKAERESRPASELFKKIAQEYEKTLKPLNELVDKHIETTNYLFESSKIAREQVTNKLKKYSQMVKEAQEKQGAEALKEEAMA